MYKSFLISATLFPTLLLQSNTSPLSPPFPYTHNLIPSLFLMSPFKADGGGKYFKSIGMIRKREKVEVAA